MWARTDAGVVAELVEIDPQGRYHPDLKWLAVPAELRAWARPGWRVVRGKLAPDPAELRADMLARLADLRWRVETGGLTLPDGSQVKTDRESQSLIAGAVLAAQLAPEPVDFKAATGWLSLSSVQVIALGQAVGAHVRAAFRREREVAQLLEAAATVDDLLGVWAEAATGWSA